MSSPVIMRLCPTFLRLVFVAAVALLAACAVASLASRALAAEPAFALDYRVPQGCPDAAVFRTRLLERLRSPTPAPQPRQLDLQVVVERRAGTLVGTLQVGGNPTSLRTVSGETCDAVLDALALVAAVTMQRETHPEQNPDRPSATAAPPPEPQPEPARQPSWSVAAQLGAAGGFAPRWLVEGGGSVQYVFDERAAGPLAWAARITFLRSVQSSFDADLGSADIQRTMARLELCPLAFPFGQAFVVRPCAGFDAGLLRVAGRQTELIVHPHSVDALWLATGAALHLQARPAQLLTLEVQAAADAVLSKHDFVTDHPDSALYSTSAVALSVGFGLGLRFF